MKDKLKTYDFWMAVASAIFVVLQAVGFTTEIPYLREVTTAFLGFLAVTGFIVGPPADTTENKEENTSADINENSSDDDDLLSNITNKIIENTK